MADWNESMLETPEGRLALEILAAKRAGYEARQVDGKWSLFLAGKQVGTFALETEADLWFQSRLRSSTDANATIFLLDMMRDHGLSVEYEHQCRSGSHQVILNPKTRRKINSGWHKTFSRAGIVAFLKWSDNHARGAKNSDSGDVR